MTSDLTIGYGPGEIEPKIAPLVHAVQKAGFVTFSSCEGHVGDDPKFASVAFYALEDAARRVHEVFMHHRRQLACSWVLRANFVLHRDSNEWVLGWTLENRGTIEAVDDEDEFIRRTVETGWQDIPHLAQMFTDIGSGSATS
jgi:hypothetical protein